MDTPKGSIVFASSRASPRFASTRVAAVRGQGKDQRAVLRRIHRGSSILAAACQHQLNKAPIPAVLKGSDCRRKYNAGEKSLQQMTWSLQHGSQLPALNLGSYNLTLAAFVHDPLAWLLSFIYRLQSKLSHLGTGNAVSAIASPISSPSAMSQAGRSGTNAARAVSSTVANATSAPTRRCSSGRYVPASATPGDNAYLRMSITRLMPVGALPSFSLQLPSVPLATLALGTAAALAVAGLWLFSRWQLQLVDQREMAQQAAAKRDHLARQKQRFQRALVVDSVNLDLPPIKDKNVQPVPVRAGQIISAPGAPPQQAAVNGAAQQRSARVPALAGDQLRKWNQFMAASRATEVMNISTSKQLRGVGGGRGSNRQAADSDPYQSLDERTLADLSDRIRRANENAAAASQPVITFEQLYANNTESDEQAMARRAAERKARWQKQQQEQATSGAAPDQRSPATRAPPSGPSRAMPGAEAISRAGPADKPLGPSTLGSGVSGSSGAPQRTGARPLDKQDGIQAASPTPRRRLVSPGNPFAVGLFTVTDTSSSSSPSQPGTSTTSSSRLPLAPREQVGSSLDSAVAASSSGRVASGLALRNSARPLPAGTQESTSNTALGASGTSAALGASGASTASLVMPGSASVACVLADKRPYSIVRYNAALGSVPTSESQGMEERTSSSPSGVTACTNNSATNGTPGFTSASGSLPATADLVSSGPIDVTLNTDEGKAFTSRASTVTDIVGQGKADVLEADSKVTEQPASAPDEQVAEKLTVNQLDALDGPLTSDTDVTRVMPCETQMSLASGTSACDEHQALCLTHSSVSTTIVDSSSPVGSLEADVRLCMEAVHDLERVAVSAALVPNTSVVREFTPSSCDMGSEPLPTAVTTQLEEMPAKTSRMRATGQLRKPESLAPELARLMRRPTASS